MLFTEDPTALPGWGIMLVTLLGGGGFAVFAKQYWQPFLDMFNKTRAERRAADLDTIASLRTEVTSLREAYRAELAEVKAENKKLEVRVALLETLQLNFPLPHWALDRTLRYVWVNGPFEDIVLRPLNKTAEGIRGLTSMDVFGSVVAAILSRITVEATRSSRGTATRAGVAFDEREELVYTVCIWPVYRGSQHIGYEGLALPEPIVPKKFEQNPIPAPPETNLSLAPAIPVTVHPQ